QSKSQRTSKMENGTENVPLPQVPCWLNQQMFIEFLERDFKDFLAVNKFQVKEPCAKGENFTTLVLRVKINVSLNEGCQAETSYIVKLLPTTFSTRNMISSWKVFDKEKLSYGCYVPEFEQMYRNVNKAITFGAKYYEASSPPTKELIILEDLGIHGFKNANRQEGLDMKHSHAVLEKLAQFHAASAVRYEVKGAYPDIYDRNLCSEEDKFQEFRDNQARSLIQALPLYEASHLENALTKLFSELKNKLPELTKYDPAEFNALIHGDCWLNNLLFKFNDQGEIDDMLFVDFQLPRFGNPSADLLNFLITSVNIDHKLRHFDYFIYFYHTQLVEHLQILDYKQRVPTLRELHMNLQKYGIWAIISIFMALPVVLLDPTEAATLDNLLSDTEAGDKFKDLLYTNKRYQMYLEQILPWLHNRGYLEA
ncbi:hypothetical protein KR222_001857, partial [Zaprionus bogoriensis]